MYMLPHSRKSLGKVTQKRAFSVNLNIKIKNIKKRDSREEIDTVRLAEIRENKCVECTPQNWSKLENERIRPLGAGFPREVREQEALPMEPSLFLSAEQRIPKALNPHLL